MFIKKIIIRLNHLNQYKYNAMDVIMYQKLKLKN